MAVLTQVFPNFSAALAMCRAGYDDADIADVISFKTALPIDTRNFSPEQALNSILAVGMAAAELPERPLTILDFGGGCGFHYFRVAASIRMPLRWVETKTMALRAAKLAGGRFEVFTDIAAAAAALERVDLVHASSSIQYVPEPITTLQTLAALRPRYFALLRFPWWQGPQTVSVQPSSLGTNGIGPMPPNIADREILYPVTFVNFNEALRTLGNYEIALAMGSASSNYELRGQQIPGVSVIFRAKTDEGSFDS